jgi:hypothetical protein
VAAGAAELETCAADWVPGVALGVEALGLGPQPAKTRIARITRAQFAGNEVFTELLLWVGRCRGAMGDVYHL